jgi:hypothetical protein
MSVQPEIDVSFRIAKCTTGATCNGLLTVVRTGPDGRPRAGSARSSVHSSLSRGVSTCCSAVFTAAATHAYAPAMATRDGAPASPLRHWSAWLPIATSVFFIVLAVRHVALYGLVRDADEGIEAHLFQLLMPMQALVIAYFALMWLPKTPGRALAVLGLQVGAAAAVFALVYWFEHS